jgi:hypothetical protein
MTKRQQVTRWLKDEVPASELGTVFVAAGFSWYRGSLEYRRSSSPELAQRFRLLFNVGYPRRDVLAYFTPDVELESSFLGILVEKMGGTHAQKAGFGRSDVVARLPLHQLAPKSLQMPWWCIHEERELLPLITEIAAFSKSWVVPFLNDYGEINSLLRGCERGDERLHTGRELYLFVAAAYVQWRQPDAALAVLERWFGGPTSRKQYASAFAYVENELAKSKGSGG